MSEFKCCAYFAVRLTTGSAKFTRCALLLAVILCRNRSLPLHSTTPHWAAHLLNATLLLAHCGALHRPLTYKYLTFCIYAFFIYRWRIATLTAYNGAVICSCLMLLTFFAIASRLMLLTVICHTRANFVASTSRGLRVSACLLLSPTTTRTGCIRCHLPHCFEWSLPLSARQLRKYFYIIQLIYYHYYQIIRMLKAAYVMDLYTAEYNHIKIDRRMFYVRRKVRGASVWRSLFASL